MDKTTVLQTLGRQTAFTLCSRNLTRESVIDAINEAVVNLSLWEDEEEIFRKAASDVTRVFGAGQSLSRPARECMITGLPHKN